MPHKVSKSNPPLDDAGARILSARRSKGIWQKWVAEKIGIPSYELSAYELMGKHVPDEVAYFAADALGVPAASIRPSLASYDVTFQPAEIADVITAVPAENTAPEILSTQQAGELLGISQEGVSYAIRVGRLPATKVGVVGKGKGEWVLTRDDVEKYGRSRRRGPRKPVGMPPLPAIQLRPAPAIKNRNYWGMALAAGVVALFVALAATAFAMGGIQ